MNQLADSKSVRERIEQAQYTGATHLDLSQMDLTELPDSIGNLTQLKTLDVSFNKLTTLSKSLGKLSQLETLKLYGNQLTTLPQSLSPLANLKELWLGKGLFGNPIENVPPVIQYFKQLEILDISRSQISFLPEWIGELSQLREIFLNPSKVVTLPSSLTKLEHLNMLMLDGSPLSPELSAVYRQGLDEVKIHLQEQAAKEIVLHEAKLLLIGDGEIEKRSLLGALRGDKWIENRATTQGVDVDIIFLTVTTDSGKGITLTGWNFGRQNIYSHTHQLFFTAPAIYLTVWNPLQGTEQCRAGEWIEIVKHRIYDKARDDSQPRVIVVAVHDGPQGRMNHIDEQTLRNKFGDLIVGFHHVDSKSKEGLDELKQVIAQTAINIPQVGRPVAESWKRVLDAVHKRRETDAWISYDDFLILCEQEGVGVSVARTYSAILNELGHWIHYSAVPMLKDTIILRPEWLSKAISFVLEDKKARDEGGLVQHDYLSELWNNSTRTEKERYPIKLHPLFLKLMERFDLSYEVERSDADAPKASLIAQLVPTKRPDDWEQSWVKRTGDAERTRVCRIVDANTGRTAEAEGLMYRLIVRLHRYSLGRENYDKSRHWKTGMILDGGVEGKALIEKIDGDIYITVRAAYPTSFLGYLCSEITGLVSSFWKGLDPRLYVPCPTDKCKGLLERNEMDAFRHQGMDKVRCGVCGKFHTIDSLLAPTAARPRWQDAVDRLEKGQQQIFQASQTNVSLSESLGVQLRALMSQVEEQYKALLTTLIDPAKDGPRLFSMEPVNRSQFDFNTWTHEEFRLTLWCEHTRLPLPLLNPNDPSLGVYTIKLSKDWVRKAAPLLRVMSVTLKLALPMAAPSIKLATDENDYKVFSEQLDFCKQSADTLLAGGEKIGSWLTTADTMDLTYTQDETRAAIKAKGSVLRELHKKLEGKDPTSQFGRLAKVQNKRHEFLWVHPQFASQYGSTF
ncbi:MAG: COR domain-containing protein [Cyanobacteria bacterium J06621_3]